MTGTTMFIGGYGTFATFCNGCELPCLDYPNELLLANIMANIRRNASLLGNGRHEVCGHLWGSDTAELLQCLDKSLVVATNDDSSSTDDTTRFDVAVVAECLWLHHLVRSLLR